MVQPEKLTVEELAKEIGKQLRGPSKEKELVAISGKLKELRRRKPRGALAIERDRLESVFRKLVEARSSKLQDQVRATLDKFKKALTAGEPSQEDLTGNTRAALKELEELDLAREDVRGWRDTLNRLEREREDLSKVLDIEREVKELWARAKSTEEQGGFGDSIVQDYKDASTKIQGHLKSSKIVSPAPKRRLGNLADQAEQLVTESANKHTLTLTRAAGNEVVTQFRAFLKSSAVNPEERVTYFLTPDKNAGYGLLPVKSAVEVAREHVRQFWSGKVTEYVDLARHKLLDEHDPYGAQGQLDKWQDLEGLHDPEIIEAGLTLSGDPQVRIKRLQTEIDDKRKTRQDAEKFCHDAMNESALSKAYIALHSAEQTDKYTPTIQSTKIILQERLVEALRACAESAEVSLNEGRWDEVDDALETADQLSALDPAVNFGDLSKRLQRVRRMLDDVRQVINDVQAQTSPAKAKGKLETFKEAFEKGYAQKLEQWEEIRQIEIDLEAQLGDRNFIDGIRAQINASATLDQLNNALEDWKRTRPKIQKEDLQKEFDALRTELDAYIGFRTANDKKSTDLATALDALTPTVLKHPVLGADAKHLWNDLNTRKEKQQDAVQAMADINKLITTDPRLAYEKAGEWKAKATFRTSDFVHLEQQALTELEKQITSVLNRELAKGSYSSAVRARIKELLAELKEIASEKELEYRNKSELPCAIAAAEELENKAKTQKSGWEGVVHAWDAAHDLAVGYRDHRADNFWEHRLEAYKKQIREQAARADFTQQIDLYSQLNSEVNEADAEVWMWLGQTHLEAASQLITRDQSQPSPRETHDE